MSQKCSYTPNKPDFDPSTKIFISTQINLCWSLCHHLVLWETYKNQAIFSYETPLQIRQGSLIIVL